MSDSGSYVGRWERERRARKRAEELLEQKSRELFEANEKLRRMNLNLEHRVSERTSELKEVNAKLVKESAERVQAEVDRCVPGREPGEVAHDLDLGDRRHSAGVTHEAHDRTSG